MEKEEDVLGEREVARAAKSDENASRLSYRLSVIAHRLNFCNGLRTFVDKYSNMKIFTSNESLRLSKIQSWINSYDEHSNG